MKLSVKELALVESSFEFKAAISGFLTIYKVSSIFNFIEIPRFGTLSMLLVLDPVSLKHASIGIYKYTVPIGFTIFPFSLVYVSINVCHSSLTIIFFITSLALIYTSITKFKYTKSFPYIFSIRFPLSFIFFSAFIF